MSNPLDVLNRPSKPKPEAPTIRFDVPPLTTEAIVNAVQNDKPIWKLLSQAAVEDEAAKRAKRISDKYDMNEIPEPEWEPNDEL